MAWFLFNASEIFNIRRMKRAVYVRHGLCLFYSSPFRHLRRRLNLIIYLLIIFFLLFSILCTYYYLPVVKPIDMPASSSSTSVQIMYVVRTSSKFYRNRLIYLLQTWISFIQNQVYFVTDELIPNISHDHLILTKNTCGEDSHAMKTLCCKTAHDFILFHRHRTKYNWFCHFDDDQYVHTKNLEKYLSTLDPHQPYYIGRNSWNTTVKRTKEPFPNPFWFATLGAGVCFSKYLIDLLEPYTQSVSRFTDGCLKENYFDDIYLGFVISGYLNVSLTKNLRFHSHLEKDFYQDKRTFFEIFTKQITFVFVFLKLIQFFFRIYMNLDMIRIICVHSIVFSIHLHLIVKKKYVNISLI